MERTATRLPTTIVLPLLLLLFFFLSTTCPFQVEEDGDIWCGVVWCGGGGKERGKRVEGPGRVETSSSSSWKLGASFCSCCRWALLVVAAAAGGASERERERERETEGTGVGWVVDRGQLGNGSQFLAQ